MSPLPLSLCNIIISYLTDLPKLAFELQLLEQTSRIREDLSIFWYSISSYKALSKYIHGGNGKYIIGHNKPLHHWKVIVTDYW